MPETLLLQQGEGYALFGPEYIAAVVCSAGLIAVLVAVYRKLPSGFGWKSPRRTFFLVLALIALARLASSDALIIASGTMIPIFWPLHICNFCEYLALAYALTGNRHVADIFYPWAMVGGISAIFAGAWMSYAPLFSWASVGGYLEHALLVAMALVTPLDEGYCPSYRTLYKPALAAIAGGLFFKWFDDVFQTNFFFVRVPQEGSPFYILFDAFGDPGFLVPYLAIAVGLWCSFIALGRALHRRLVR